MKQKLNQLKTEARERLRLEQKLYYRSKGSVEDKAVFEHIESNNKFTQFCMKGLETVVSFGLKVILIT